MEDDKDKEPNTLVERAEQINREAWEDIKDNMDEIERIQLDIHKLEEHRRVQRRVEDVAMLVAFLAYLGMMALGAAIL